MIREMMHSIRKFLSAPYRRQAVVFAVGAALLVTLPAASEAAGLTGDSSTYVQSRETADDSRLLPLYEYLNFTVQDVGKEGISFQFGGWVRFDLGDESFDNKKSGNDLQYAYVAYRHDTDNALVKLGRVPIFEGVAAERVDGVYVRTDLVSGFGVSAFGGSPAETGINEPGNNVIYGGRVSHQYADLYRVGVSYLKEEKNSEDFRKETGVDLWLRPLDKVELTGRSSYNSVTTGWMEHAYFLSLGPFAKLRLNTEASWINYEDYFSAAVNPAFRFSPEVIDPREKVGILGEEVSYPVTDKLTVSAVYKNYSYNIAGSAGYFGGKASYSVGKSWGAGASVSRMAGDTDRLKYTEYRAYGYKKIDKFDLALDILNVAYDEAINGVNNAYTLVAAAGYNLTDTLRLGANVDYSKNPDFDKDVRAFVKLNYLFDLGAGKKGGV